MVDFKTRIFTESDNDIIGAEVIVFSDQGTRIGSIEIANAEDLNALREQLEVIDETYFDETRLNAVLANSQESTTINATSISGYSSSDLAKVSQLSGYALTNHTHVKTSITDLYNYSISCSNYNPTIDTDISVTVKVTNQAGNPVVGHTVSILKNNSSWKSGTTGSNGEFTTTYTCSEWGLITFSAKNHNTLQILVKGYKDWYNSNNLILQANKLTGMSKLSLTRNLTINANSKITLKDAYTQGSDNEVICPYTTLKVPTSRDNIWIEIDYLGKVVAINTSNSNISNLNVQCNTSWSFKNNNY